MKAGIERFKGLYADSAVAADPQRKPSLAEMEKAVADLGPMVRVRRDGKGDAATIQGAIDKAPPNATIQVEETGPWIEPLAVPLEKDDLTICGKTGVLPIITTAGAKNSYAETLLVHSPRLSLKNLVIVRDDAGGPPRTAVSAEKTALTLCGVIVRGHMQADKVDSRKSVFAAEVRAQNGITAQDSAFIGHVHSPASCSFQNVLVCGGADCGSDSRLRRCTITGALQVSGMGSTVLDSILSSVGAANSGDKIDHCNVFGNNPYVEQAAAGKRCLSAPPRFVNAKNLDFRLLPDSPCRKTASDGGDMGFAVTPELRDLLGGAGELHARRGGKL